MAVSDRFKGVDILVDQNDDPKPNSIQANDRNQWSWSDLEFIDQLQQTNKFLRIMDPKA